MRLVDVGEEAGVQAPAIYYYWPAQTIDSVVATAQSIVRHGIAAEGL